MAELNMEVVEGPDAGRDLTFAGPTVIGRAADADLVLTDGEVSRRHVRLTPDEHGGVMVEDLGSANGTFVNQNELEGPTHLSPGDELLLGVSVLRLRTSLEASTGMSGVITVPPALAAAPRPPTYVNPEVVRVEETAQPVVAETGFPTVEKYLDVRVRRRAQLAPLAYLALIAIALIIYFTIR